MYLQHLSDEILEEYIFGRLSTSETNMLETHILACDRCLSRLEALETDIRILKAAWAPFVSSCIAIQSSVIP